MQRPYHVEIYRLYLPFRKIGESWLEPGAGLTDTGAAINILDIGRQNYANGGVISRYLCDLVQCINLVSYDYKDVVPDVAKDERFQRAIEDTTQDDLYKLNHEKGGGDGSTGNQYLAVRRKVEAKAMKVLHSISSAMSNGVLKFVAWVCHKAIRRIAGGGCSTRAACVERLRRANSAGLPLVFVPLHRSHFDYVLVTFTLYLSGLRPPLVAAGDNMKIPFFGWFLRGCGAFYIRRRVDGSEYHGDPVYKSALRAYILQSLAEKNNLEFFIEGGRTRTGKPQPPKAGILSVIMDAYLDGTIDDALLVPVTLNYDKLVDGNFVREQLGMPKQMETFWSALRGIWRTLNTNHGGIRVDFNQPISLKELVTSFQKYNYLKAPIEKMPAARSNNLAVNLDRQILYNHSNSSLYGEDVSMEYKIMVEGIGRHLVYDAARSTALMSTNVVSYVLLTEYRNGCTLKELRSAVRLRGDRLRSAGRDLAYSGDDARILQHALPARGFAGLDMGCVPPSFVLNDHPAPNSGPGTYPDFDLGHARDCTPGPHSMDMLGRLIHRDGAGERANVRAQNSVAAALELSYYANTIVTHYAAPAIVVTALESIIREPDADTETVSHTELMERSLQLSEILSEEFILCAPCQRIEDLIIETIDSLVLDEVLSRVENSGGLEEEKWSQRYARMLDEEMDDSEDNVCRTKYRVCKHPEALANRRRLLLTVRPLLEAYAATCRALAPAPLKAALKRTLDVMVDDYTHNNMLYGEAVSTDAIRNCLRLLKQWGVVEMYTEDRERRIRLRPPYDSLQKRNDMCASIYKFNVNTPLLRQEV
ncbi:Glycerol-3-phosphate acyltransferase 1, mitochondrial [Eumeta japonica]|uniref:Glycerol-3-phosphate acyltransferase 1, mitochondrial n=1 Tax=Eumeta variegata TaxID=151549 RepID=A0A4C1SY99_EUMVA|nr:Glycerol-3-phosphate acyltransferase 1, mitochondrial [Eumeta japonica]